ncbi:hypothetical protein DN433_00580 [Lactobacillus reuteri]|nr:hypothetical protein [Limosilactobacillus reuteri]MQB98090.1 hypothetical protein [Limosilactobacillus reuteri]
MAKNIASKMQQIPKSMNAVKILSINFSLFIFKISLELIFLKYSNQKAVSPNFLCKLNADTS